MYIYIYVYNKIFRFQKQFLPIQTAGGQPINKSRLLAACGFNCFIRWIYDITHTKYSWGSIKSPHTMLGSGQIKTYSSGQMKTYSSGQMKTYSSGQIKTYSSGQIKTYASDQIKTYSSGQMKTYSSGQMNTYSSGQMNTYSSEQIKTYSSYCR